mmetsp:Transcript_2268/g.7198  ORF Transcript_2268/g.7198 Transcript_2268/m.7198 type:complete len:80 (-) Transcript_2268:13-252(-)
MPTSNTDASPVAGSVAEPCRLGEAEVDTAPSSASSSPAVRDTPHRMMHALHGKSRGWCPADPAEAKVRELAVDAARTAL